MGQELTLAQIIKVNRHPKLKFLVGVEKEIIAKVVVKKAVPAQELRLRGARSTAELALAGTM